MVKFEPVDVDEFENEIKSAKKGHRGRVSYPLLKMFLESDLYMAKLDRTGMQQSLRGLYSCLRSYIENHDMPIKIRQRSGEIYLQRTDVDKDGNPIDKEEAEKEREEEAKEITPESIEKEAKEAIGQ